MTNKTKTAMTKKETPPALVPKLRFPEFQETEKWGLATGDTVFDNINNRNPEPGLLTKQVAIHIRKLL